MAANCESRDSSVINSSIEEIKQMSEVACNFLRDFKPAEYADGRYELEDGVYVNIETYETQERKDRRFEVHEKYIDVQYIVEGEELITLSKIEGLNLQEAYDPQRDIAFYQTSVQGKDHFVSEGQFLIIETGVAHMPCVCVNGKQTVRKVVVKIPA